MSALDSLNDFSWSLLEKVHLANFFEDKNIPPFLFLIAIICVLSVLVFLILTPPSEVLPPQDGCGDNNCDSSLGENIASCPSDCSTTTASLNTVSVIITGDIQNLIEVTLYTGDHTLIQTIEGTENEFDFSGVPSDFVIATVRNPENGEVFSSNVISVEDGVTEISLFLPDDFFEKSGVPPKATLRILLKDADTGMSLVGDVTLYEMDGEREIFIKTENINGAISFAVDASTWYKVSASVPGYPVYEGNKIKIEPGKQRDYPINLRKPDTPLEPASLTVCVKDNPESFLSGQVTLYDMASNQLESKLLSGGCAVFETIPQTILVTTTDLPENCIDTNSEITLTDGDNEHTLIVSCPTTLPSYARIKVTNESGATVTQDAFITMWYSDDRRILGSGTSWSLAVGEGGYTEYLEVDSTKTFYFIITNLDGYATTITEMYSIDIGTNKSISVTMSPPPPPLYDITINGLTYTDTVATDKQFPVTVSGILFGQTDVTHSANLTVQISGIDCEVSGLEATCTAPSEAGEYDLAVTASYEGQEGVQVVQVRVLEDGGRYFFRLIPHAVLNKEPPLLLNFDIKFNGSLTDSLSENDVTIDYVLGGVRVDKIKLSNVNTTFSMRVDTPFPGDHTAEIYLQKIANEKLYEQNFTHYFESEPTSPRLTSVQSVNPRILKPRENFFVYMRIKNAGKDVPELENVHVTIDGKRTTLDWDDELKTYVAHFTASQQEGIYSAKFEIESQELGSVNFYVIDVEKSKSSECKITQCETRPDVRICVDKYKNHDEYTEQDTIRCIESGWSIPGSDISCLSGAGNRGDWNADCTLTGADLNVHENALKKIPDQIERNEYWSCGDMDSDSDVDAIDQTCLSNVISTKWFGDVGDGTCDKQMNGGFCYDIGTSSSLKGDFDDSNHIDVVDINIMSAIMRDVSRGINPPQKLLDFADFNQDGVINGKDKTCLESFQNLNIQDMIQNIQAGGANMPDFNLTCLNVYNIGCGTQQKGDLDGDRKVTETDILILGLLVADVGDIMTSYLGTPIDSSGQDVNWDAEFTVSKGENKVLPKPIPYDQDWVFEMEGDFDFSEKSQILFREGTQAHPEETYGTFILFSNNWGHLPGQTLKVSPGLVFALSSNPYGCHIAVTKAFKGVPFGCFGMTLQTIKTGNDKIKIEYFFEERRYKVYWNGHLVGHYEVSEDEYPIYGTLSGGPNIKINEILFESSSGTVRYYVGDLDPDMTKFGPLDCADFNQDGTIDETDFLCMAASLTSGFSKDNPFCYSCTQRGVDEGWYYPFELCWDGYDNDCDTTIDIARGGSRVDANGCNACPNFRQGEVGGTWCWRGPYWDLDRGISPGIEDGNYGICMSQSWTHEDYWGETVAPLVKHPEHIDDIHEPECTPEMQCHFTSCFDNYRICSSSGAWRQFGGGANHVTDDTLEQQLIDNRDAWVQDYSPEADSDYSPGELGFGDFIARALRNMNTPLTDIDGNIIDRNTYIDENTHYYIETSTGNLIDPESGYYVDIIENPDTGDTINYLIDPDTGNLIDPSSEQVTDLEGTPDTAQNFENQRISMDGQHYIGSIANTYTINGLKYYTLWGPWGDFLRAEGSTPTAYRDGDPEGTPSGYPPSYCGNDEWNDNCYGGIDPCFCVDDTSRSCGDMGGTSCPCSLTNPQSDCSQLTNPCGSDAFNLNSSDCEVCCVPSSLCS